MGGSHKPSTVLEEEGANLAEFALVAHVSGGFTKHRIFFDGARRVAEAFRGLLVQLESFIPTAQILVKACTIRKVRHELKKSVRT